MLTTVASALLPVLFMLALGYGAGRAHAFPKDAVAVITKLVLDFALPAALFLGTVTVSREALLAQMPLFTSFLLVVAVVWIVVFACGRWLFGHDVAEASLQALLVSLAAVPFYGLAMMSHLFGASAGIAVSTSSIIVNIAVLPTVIILAIGGDTAGHRDKSKLSTVRVIGGASLKALATPYIVAPIIGVVMVLIGLHLPSLLIAPFQLAGSGSSAVGLFVGGLTLASVKLKVTWETAFNVIAKLVAMPALFVGAATLIGASVSAIDQGALLAGLPCGPIAVLLGTQHKKYQTEASTSLAASTLGFIATFPILLLLFHPGAH